MRIHDSMYDYLKGIGGESIQKWLEGRARWGANLPGDLGNQKLRWLLHGSDSAGSDMGCGWDRRVGGKDRPRSNTNHTLWHMSPASLSQHICHLLVATVLVVDFSKFHVRPGSPALHWCGYDNDNTHRLIEIVDSSLGWKISRDNAASAELYQNACKLEFRRTHGIIIHQPTIILVDRSNFYANFKKGLSRFAASDPHKTP